MKHIADKHQMSILLHAHNSLLTVAVADGLSSFQSESWCTPVPRKCCSFFT